MKFSLNGSLIMQSEGFSVTAFVLSLLAGILILVKGIFSCLFLAVGGYGVFGDSMMGDGSARTNDFLLRALSSIVQERSVEKVCLARELMH